MGFSKVVAIALDPLVLESGSDSIRSELHPL